MECLHECIGVSSVLEGMNIPPHCATDNTSYTRSSDTVPKTVHTNPSPNTP